MRLEITATAYQDLNDIEAYTLGVWGAKQAEKYLDALYAAMDRIMEDPLHLLKSDDRISAHLVFYRVEKHFIFCDVTEDRVSVLTIQHAARDLPARIAELETSLPTEAEMLHKKVCTAVI
jgi:plasmid stabilization system protein ParE